MLGAEPFAQVASATALRTSELLVTLTGRDTGIMAAQLFNLPFKDLDLLKCPLDVSITIPYNTFYQVIQKMGRLDKMGYENPINP